MIIRFMLPCLVCAVSVWGASPDFFPLQPGNQWVLQTASARPELLNIEVLRSRTLDKTTYFLVAGFAPEEQWIRKAEDGTLYALDEAAGREAVLARPGLGASGYLTPLSGCEQPAQPAATAVAHRGPYFQFAGTLAVKYSPGTCRDIGLTSEVYAPGVGLVRRSITTIRGEVTFDLIYARVNGAAQVSKSGEIVVKYDFHRGSKGWLAGFADYDRRTSDLRMLAELRPLPDEVSRNRSGFYLQSMNRSDDLFMYLKKQVGYEDGIAPNQTYLVWFEIRFSSNAPTGCVGVGGSPGDAVYLKAGGSTDEPVTKLEGSGMLHASIDKGQQSVGGLEAGLVGTIANGTACEGSGWPYISVSKEYAHPHPVRTDERGSFWLSVGTDSAYEGLTGLYVESITVRIHPSASTADRR
jgi:hypothetical protein